jgi:hypothetical protein
METSPGFLQTTDFIAQMVGPTGQDFTFSDYHSRDRSEPVLLWFAREQGERDPAREELENLAALSRDAGAAREESRLSRHLALGLLWWDPALPPLPPTPTLPLHWTAGGKLPVAVLRSAWNDPNAIYLAIKGGTPDHSHAHMDVGSFVYEADGVRWAVDPGTESYDRQRAATIDLWNYSQNSTRWTVFRNGPEGHNILRFDDGLQNTGGHAVIATLPDKDGVWGNVVDLSPLWSGHVVRANRTVRLFPDRCAEIADSWTTGDRAVVAAAQWLTMATVRRTDDGVMLQQAGRHLGLTFTASAPMTVTIEDVSAARRPQDSSNPGLSRIIVRVETQDRSEGHLSVTITPSEHSLFA